MFKPVRPSVVATTASDSTLPLSTCSRAPTSPRARVGSGAAHQLEQVPQNGVSFLSGFLASCEILDLDIY